MPLLQVVASLGFKIAS